MRQSLISEQKGGLHMVAPRPARMRFELHGKGHRVVSRSNSLVPDSKRKRPRKTTEVTVNAVILFFHGPVTRLIMMAHPKTPVRIEAVVKSGVDDVFDRFGF